MAAPDLHYMSSVVVRPRQVDAEAITAHFRHGLLAIHVPWGEGKRKIRVQVEEPNEA